MLLMMVAAISPKAMPFSQLIEQFYMKSEDRLRLLVGSLNVLCKRNMEDVIAPQDILTNNTASIIQLIAYLYLTHHSLGILLTSRSIEPLGPLRESEESCQKAVVDQVYRSLVPFMRASLALGSVPVLSPCSPKET